MSARLWPTGLIGRVGLVLLATVVLELLASSVVFERAELVSSDEAEARHIAEQLDTAARVLAVTSPGNRAAVARTLSDTDLTLSWLAQPSTLALPSSDERTRKVRDRLLSARPGLAERHLALQPMPADPDTTAQGTLDLPDGSALRFRLNGLGGAVPDIFDQLLSMVVVSIGVLLAALVVVRTLAAPLRMLVRVTDTIGVGPPVEIDDKQGPREIRAVARAFNAMQARISKLLDDRVQALAAVSHDLRTPIARLRLRADLAGEGHDRTAFDADLAEMEAMLDDLNAYLRGDSDPEKRRRVDVAAMLQTLVDDATDAGHVATYDGPDHIAADLRALAVKRSVSNVVNNAIAYGDCAHVRLHADQGELRVTVEDRGPGIADRDRDAVFDPFFRGDSSRNRATGGMGLGLSITRQAIEREGGRVALANRPEGGLRVTITLPIASPPPRLD